MRDAEHAADLAASAAGRRAADNPTPDTIRGAIDAYMAAATVPGRSPERVADATRAVLTWEARLANLARDLAWERDRRAREAGRGPTVSMALLRERMDAERRRKGYRKAQKSHA